MHAGCDLYAPIGTEILAVKDGVILDFYEFYNQTWVLDVDHGNFIARYGEVAPAPVSEYPTGKTIKQGQIVGHVGKLIENGIQMTMNGKKLEMLHFEMYSGKASGIFRDDSNKYCRRSDLIDPTEHLDNATIV